MRDDTSGFASLYHWVGSCMTRLSRASPWGDRSAAFFFAQCNRNGGCSLQRAAAALLIHGPWTMASGIWWMRQKMSGYESGDAHFSPPSLLKDAIANSVRRPRGGHLF